MPPALPTLVRDRLDTYRDVLRRHFGDRLVELRLFGSYARGDAGPDSDVDVLVLLRDPTSREILEAMGLAADADHLQPPMLSTKVFPADLHRRLVERAQPFHTTVDRESIAV